MTGPGPPEGATEGATPRVEASPGFAGWLAARRASLVLSTYQSGKIVWVGTAGGRIVLGERGFDRAMGLCAAGSAIWLATLFQVWRFETMTAPGDRADDCDRLYLPQAAYTTGLLDTHDIAADHAGRPVFANTLFNCVATTGERTSFTPLWTPPFITELVPEDRCHLNGLALEDGRVRYVTALSAENTKGSWRTDKTGGCLIDVARNAVAVGGLSMPHSPRIHGGRVWLHNSGTGEFGAIEEGAFAPTTFLPGYLRGLVFLDGFAVMTLSRPRHDESFDDLPLGARLARAGLEPWCGLAVVDMASGEVAHTLRFHDLITELYDVAAIEGCTNPSIVGMKGEDAMRTYAIGRPGGGPVPS